MLEALRDTLIILACLGGMLIIARTSPSCDEVPTIKLSGVLLAGCDSAQHSALYQYPR